MVSAQKRTKGRLIANIGGQTDERRGGVMELCVAVAHRQLAHVQKHLFDPQLQ